MWRFDSHSSVGEAPHKVSRAGSFDDHHAGNVRSRSVRPLKESIGGEKINHLHRHRKIPFVG
jgi:hypothetical protein